MFSSLAAPSARSVRNVGLDHINAWRDPEYDLLRPEGGSGLTDLQVYERHTLGGGFGYSEEDLLHIFGSHFDLVEMRRMKEMQPVDRSYGKEFLSAVRMVKR